MRTHQEIDELNYELDRAVSAKLRRNPKLFGTVIVNLKRWRARLQAEGEDGSRSYLLVWEAIVEKGLNACLEIAEDKSERAAELRQASPFAGILTEAERQKILDRYRDRHEARAI